MTEKFSPLTDDPSVQKLISREYAFETFLIDSRHRMWLAVGGGGIVCVNLSSSKVTQYMADSEKDTLTVGRYKTVHIFEDNKGDIYFSTIGAGIFKYQEKQDTFKSYGTTTEYFRVIIVIISASLPGIIVCLFCMGKGFLSLIVKRGYRRDLSLVSSDL